MNNSNELKMTVYASLFVALITIGAFLVIPIGPVPIVLQNMFVLLSAIILGPSWGLASIAVYLLIGLVGLPVFSSGGAGLGKIFGPTGGYLLGYVPAVFFTAQISKAFKQKFSGDIIAMTAGSLIIYAAGVPWLKISLSLTWKQSVFTGMFPFLIGDIVKILAAAFIARVLRPIIKI